MGCGPRQVSLGGCRPGNRDGMGAGRGFCTQDYFSSGQVAAAHVEVDWPIAFGRNRHADRPDPARRRQEEGERLAQRFSRVQRELDFTLVAGKPRYRAGRRGDRFGARHQARSFLAPGEAIGCRQLLTVSASQRCCQRPSSGLVLPAASIDSRQSVACPFPRLAVIVSPSGATTNQAASFRAVARASICRAS